LAKNSKLGVKRLGSCSRFRHESGLNVAIFCELEAGREPGSLPGQGLPVAGPWRLARGSILQVQYQSLVLEQAF